MNTETQKAGQWRALESAEVSGFFSIDEIDEKGYRVKGIAYITLPGAAEHSARIVLAVNKMPELVAALEKGILEDTVTDIISFREWKREVRELLESLQFPIV